MYGGDEEYKNLKTSVKKPSLGKHGLKWHHIVNMDLKEVWCGNVVWM
jgi:hypothetical protein